MQNFRFSAVIEFRLFNLSTPKKEIKGFFSTRLLLARVCIKADSNGLIKFKYNVEINLRHLTRGEKLLNVVEEKGNFSSSKEKRAIYNASMRSDKKFKYFLKILKKSNALINYD